MHATVVSTVHPLTACTVHTIPPPVLKKDSTNPNLNHQIEYLLEITLLDYDLHLKNPVLMCATCVLCKTLSVVSRGSGASLEVQCSADKIRPDVENQTVSVGGKGSYILSKEKCT